MSAEQLVRLIRIIRQGLSITHNPLVEAGLAPAL